MTTESLIGDRVTETRQRADGSRSSLKPVEPPTGFGKPTISQHKAEVLASLKQKAQAAVPTVFAVYAQLPSRTKLGFG